MGIKNNIFIKNGVAISTPKGTELDVEGNIMVDNGKGIEIRDDLTSLTESLIKEVLSSNLDIPAKRSLIEDISLLAKSKGISEKEKDKFLDRLKPVGRVALDIFLRILPFIIKSQVS